jgi:hypothetical protein
MGCRHALKVAIDLLHLPSQATLIRASPLPDDVLILLRIAAGEKEATNQASVLEDRPPEMVREAAAFFLEQVLFHADADSYRALGATSKASSPELRRNMTLLLQWLHPDLDHSKTRSVFAAKVTCAWNDLKTPERRAAYDRAQDLVKAKKLSLHGLRAKSKKPAVWRHGRRAERKYAGLSRTPDSYTGFLRKVLLLLFGRFV